MSEKISSEISTPRSEILLRPDGIVQVTGSNHVYTANDIQLLHQSIKDLAGNKKVRLLVIGDTYTSMDIEARQFLSTPEAAALSIAEAYIIKSLAQRLLMTFLIKVTGSLIPRRFFDDIGPAVDWLKTFG